MTTILHSTLGLIASLLSAAGFDRAANYIDMHIQGIADDEIGGCLAAAVPCTGPCAAAIPCTGPCADALAEQV
ncbi:MAG: hypothetical protein R3F03_02125 [Opitutaceae bacterium]